MNKKIIKKIWLIISLIIFNMISFPLFIYAKDNIEVKWFNIIPEITEEETSKVNDAIKEIWQTWWEVRDKYNKKAKEWDNDPSKQIASWIMTRDTIMDYIVFVVKFLSQLGLLVGTWFIMFAWYKYMLSVFNWWKTPTETIKNAIIWVIIVIFSYAIMKILTSFIWIS